LTTVSPSTTTSYWQGASTGAWGSASTPVTPVAPASTTSAFWGGAASTPVAAASTWSNAPVSPATFTGAANANTGSFAVAGLVAAAALVLA